MNKVSKIEVVRKIFLITCLLVAGAWNSDSFAYGNVICEDNRDAEVELCKVKGAKCRLIAIFTGSSVYRCKFKERQCIAESEMDGPVCKGFDPYPGPVERTR